MRGASEVGARFSLNFHGLLFRQMYQLTAPPQPLALPTLHLPLPSHLQLPPHLGQPLRRPLRQEADDGPCGVEG